MTTPIPTPDAAQMPPLPVVAYLRTAETMGSPVVSKEFVDKYPEHKFEFDEPLCKVSDAQAYAAQSIADAQQSEANIGDARVAAYKWAYEYLQDRMNSIDRFGWAKDCDDEIKSRINAAIAAQGEKE